MMRSVSLVVGLGVLAAVWLGPLPALARHSFAAHMTMHMAIVALGAPLLALGTAGTTADPVRRMPGVVSAVPASMIELVVVWSWHVPVLHEAARHGGGALILEQATFAAAGLLLWTAAIGGTRDQRHARVWSGVAALLLTSMHMTLLGALFALGQRPLFHAAAPVADQQLGGVIMLLVGGVAYLLGGLALMAVALRGGAPPARRRESAA
jgi:putative membrane protein